MANQLLDIKLTVTNFLLMISFSDDTEDATRSQKRMESSSSVERSQKRMESSSSVESITPKRFYRKSSNESTPTSGRKRKLQEKDASPVRVKRKTKKKAEPISPDLISDHEEEKENKKKDRKKQEGDGNLEASEEVSNSLKARRESDEMVAPSPHSTSVMSQRMRKGVQRKTKTAVTPREKNVASSGYQDTPVTRNNNEKKKQSSGNRVEETEGNSSETPTDDSIEELLTPSRRRKKITPSVYNTKNRKELHEDTDSATPVMEEITVRRSPRSGSVDTEKAGSSEGSSSLLRKVHAKKIKELQSGSESADKEERREQKIDENLLAKQQVCAEDTNKNKNETDSNETKNSAIDQFSPSYEMSQEQRRDVNPGPSTRIKPVKERSGIDRDRGSPAPSPRTKKLKEDAGQSPVRTSPRIRGRESANSLESNKVSNEARKQNENVGKTSTRSDISATEAKESKYGDAQLNDQYDNNSSEDDEELEIIMEIDADVASDESEDHYMDASEDQEDEDEFVDASEEMPPSGNMKVNASVEPKPEIIVISGSSGKPQNQEQQVEKTEEVKIPTVRRSKRSNGATPKNEERTTDEQYLEDDSEEAVGPTQEIRRVMGDLTESPQKKPKKSINDSEKLSRRKNTNVENKAKESPLIASSNNRERVESGEDNETPVLGRTRRILKDSPLLKEIHNEEGDFASPMGSKRRDDTPRAVVTGKVITAENTLKESPQFARFRNRRRIESSDEESAAEETPGTIRLKKGIAQSNQVKEIDGENTNSKISDDETPVLRRTRRLHKDSPLLKEINSTAGDFVSPHSDKKRKVAPNVSTAKVIAKKDTPKEPPQIARLRNRKIIESSDDESGAEVTPVAARRKTVGKNRETKETEENDETPVLRRTRRMHKESPLAKEIDHTDDDCLIPTGSRQRQDALKTKSTSRVTAPDDTPKESPQFARLRNRRRIESSDEESATEETPRATRRMGLLESPLVKELNDKNIGTNKTPKGTSGLRATRGSARKGTPQKGINDQDKGGKDKQARPHISMTENLEPATSNGKLTRTTENGHEKQSVEEEEDNENDVQAASNELSGSDESLEQFQTPSKKIDKEVTLNYKAMSPIKIDKEITLNVGRDSPRSKISQSSLQNSNRKIITPKRSPCKAGSARKQKEVSDRSPARQEGRAETPRSPPRHKHSELEDLWEHTPKGQYGRWKKPGQILYKVPSPPSVSRLVETEVVPSVADRIFPASDTPPCATSATKRGNVGSHQGPIELFAKSPRILRASRASPSPSKAAKDKAPEIDSPKVTPRSTRKTRQTSGTPGNEKNAEGRNLRSPAIKTPKTKR